MYITQWKGQVPIGSDGNLPQFNYVVWTPNNGGHFMAMGLLVPSNIIKYTAPGEPPPGKAQIFYCPAAEVAAGLPTRSMNFRTTRGLACREWQRASNTRSDRSTAIRTCRIPPINGI